MQSIINCLSFFLKIVVFCWNVVKSLFHILFTGTVSLFQIITSLPAALVAVTVSVVVVCIIYKLVSLGSSGE